MLEILKEEKNDRHEVFQGLKIAHHSICLIKRRYYFIILRKKQNSN